MCCEPSGYNEDEINGTCEDCSEPTVDGYAYYYCSYSPLECVTCGYRPCDLSC